MTQNIRQTVNYTLYRGYRQTAKLFSVIKRKTVSNPTIGYTETWLNEMQKEELVKLSDDEFDIKCSKIEFK